MSEHTPGPWKWDKRPSLKNQWDIKGKNGEFICMMIPLTPRGEQFPEVAANARLIAAAPELLAALKAALSANGRTVGQAWDDVPLEPWEVAARAAVAKAEGK